MVRSTTQWFCETCGTEHASEDDALTCEGIHCHNVKIVDMYHSIGSVIPTQIKVEILINTDTIETRTFSMVHDSVWKKKGSLTSEEGDNEW